jgi:hypothetical protein
MKINIDELSETVSILLLKLKESKGTEIELTNDYFWDIPEEELYRVSDDPKDLSIGSLVFDWEQVKKALQSDEAIPYDLQRISNIIKALSIENPIAF